MKRGCICNAHYIFKYVCRRNVQVMNRRILRLLGGSPRKYVSLVGAQVWGIAY